MATVDPRKLALDALSRNVAEPSPKVLHGSKTQPGIFPSAAKPAKLAAQMCLDHAWLEPTGAFQGPGKTRKAFYRVSKAGLREVLQNQEAATLLKDMQATLEQQAHGWRAALELIRKHQEIVGQLLDRIQPPDLTKLLQGLAKDDKAASAGDWLGPALHYLEDYQRRHPTGFCPLPELYRHIAEPRQLTIGAFHDGLRHLVRQGKVRLHPFTGAAYQLQDEQYALLAGQEIKFYAERIAGADGSGPARAD